MAILGERTCRWAHLPPAGRPALCRPLSVTRKQSTPVPSSAVAAVHTRLWSARSACCQVHLVSSLTCVELSDLFLINMWLMAVRSDSSRPRWPPGPRSARLSGPEPAATASTDLSPRLSCTGYTRRWAGRPRPVGWPRGSTWQEVGVGCCAMAWDAWALMPMAACVQPLRVPDGAGGGERAVTAGWPPPSGGMIHSVVKQDPRPPRPCWAANHWTSQPVPCVWVLSAGAGYL